MFAPDGGFAAYDDVVADRTITYVSMIALAALSGCGAHSARQTQAESAADDRAPRHAEAKERGVVLEASADAAAPSPSSMTPALDYARKRYGRRIGVTVGIDAYRAPIGRLDAAVSDSRRMAQLFKDLGFDEVLSIEDTAATKAGIVDLIGRRVPALTRPNDLVVVYFAGHGHSVGDMGFVLPQDATKKVAESSLSVQELKEAALRMKAPHVLFLVDACFSGSMFKKGAPEGEKNDRAYWESAEQKRVVQIVTAGAADEKVLEYEGWGAFTHAVHDGIGKALADANHDSVVTVEELARYVSERVTRETKGAQHPQWGAVEGTGTSLLWDARALPAAARTSRVSRPVLPGLEAPMHTIADLMERREWRAAEQAVRDLMLGRSHAELHLLLAEIYLGADPLGNAALVDAELRHAEAKSPNPDEQRRMFDLRSRLERAKRGPF
jgi:uncharacterized caspase-like protein